MCNVNLAVNNFLSLLWDIFVTLICLWAIGELTVMWQILQRCLILCLFVAYVIPTKWIPTESAQVSTYISSLCLLENYKSNSPSENKIDQTSLTSLECIEQSINFEAHLVIALRRMIVELRQWGLELGKESIKLFVFIFCHALRYS